jgi:hypothetical protein
LVSGQLENELACVKFGLITDDTDIEELFIFLIGHININKGVFCLIINYLQIKSYNVLNYNNCSTD